MNFSIRLGLPEMDEMWRDMSERNAKGELGGDEKKRYKKIGKAMHLLSGNPRHPGLQTHEIEALSKKYGFKVYQSYLENNTPSAGRMFWAYGPKQKEITVLGVEPHPEDEKKGAYARVKLSRKPD